MQHWKSELKHLRISSPSPPEIKKFSEFAILHLEKGKDAVYIAIVQKIIFLALHVKYLYGISHALSKYAKNFL